MYSFDQLPIYKGERELPGLQILKFICAIMVVQIHTYSAIGKYILPLCHIAVPVFFIISGYFIVSAQGIVSSARLRKIFVKLMQITIFVTIIYFFYNLVKMLMTHMDLDIYTRPSYWINEILFGTSVQSHLWYLTSYLEVLIVMLILIRLNKFPILLVLIPVGIAINLVMGSYGFLLFDEDNSLLLSRNTLTIAIPCVMIGILLRIYESRLPSAKAIVWLLISAILLLYVEVILIDHSAGDIIIMTVPVAVFSFLFFLRYNPKGKIPHLLWLWGKNHSLDIYLWHSLVAAFFYSLQCRIGLHTGLNTFIVAGLTLALSMCIKPATIPNKCFDYLRRGIFNRGSKVL